MHWVLWGNSWFNAEIFVRQHLIFKISQCWSAVPERSQDTTDKIGRKNKKNWVGGRVRDEEDEEDGEGKEQYGNGECQVF